MEEIKYKPFDLEKAKAGAKVMTKSGHPARVICTDFKNDDKAFPIIAVVMNNSGFEDFDIYTEDGRFSTYGESDADLVMCPEKHEGWINIYSTVEGCRFTRAIIYESKADAVSGGEKRYDYVTTIKIEWEE